MELLPMYNFVVTQDEDYLNLICHNKVCWLPQKWNVEVFGQIPCREEEICVLHYIMVSKPWHYNDCRLQEYFWESAQKTSVYAEIRKVLESYTDEERKRDAESCDRLMQTAKDEIAKENNYLNLVKAGKLKSKDRLEVLEKLLCTKKRGVLGKMWRKIRLPVSFSRLRSIICAKIKEPYQDKIDLQSSADIFKQDH